MLLVKVRISFQSGQCDYVPQAPPSPPQKKTQLRHWPRVNNESDQPFLSNSNSLKWTRTSSLPRLHDHTQTHTIFGRTPLDEWSARRRDFYLTTHNTHNRQAFMSAAGFEPAPVNERPYNQALGRAVNVNDCSMVDYISWLRKLLWNVAYCRTSERERERERETVSKKCTYGKKLIYLHHVVQIWRMHEARLYITRQSIRMCTYM